MYDVLALGELLIDFTPHGTSESGANLFEQNPGGAPANVLTAMTRLGCHTGFIGKVGDDMHGHLLKDTLDDCGIDTRGLVVDPTVFTTLAFVALKNGERSFSFARKPGADTQLRPEELLKEQLTDTRIFHFGSLSLTDHPAREATMEALKIAKEAGALISYDPNYRAPLWPDIETAVAEMRKPIPYVDIMKISDEETALLTGKEDPEEAADILLSQGVSCVVVTLGSEGALMKTADFCVREKTRKRTVVDTTGAGDSFWGGILTCIVDEKADPATLTKDQGSRFLRFANSVAGLCVEKRGAIPAMPDRAAVEADMKLNA